MPRSPGSASSRNWLYVRIAVSAAWVNKDSIRARRREISSRRGPVSLVRAGASSRIRPAGGRLWSMAASAWARVPPEEWPNKT